MSETANYPDLLGTITGGQRCNLGAAQVAVAARPRIVHAGRPFEVILLVQNCVEDEIDVTMMLHLPRLDAKKQRERFISKTHRLVVGVKGAEVGYIALPVTTLPDTAIADGYEIGVEIEVKPPAKSNHIRSSEGGGELNLDALSAETRSTVEALKLLSFSTAKQRLRNIIEVPVTVLSGSLGKYTDFTPGWVSVCKLTDYNDTRLLLHRYGPLVQVNTLPKLKRATMFKPLLDTTQTRFAEAGFSLKEAEATAIAKLMALILEYASPRFNAHGGIAAGSFNVEALIARDPFDFETPPTLPYWFRSLIDTLERDERAASYPSQVIPRYLYLDLLRDAISLGFELVLESTGEDLGSEQDCDQYREQLVGMIEAKAGLDFSHAYLPLVMGGVLINDQFALGKENPADLLRGIGLALEDRSADFSEADRDLYTMTNGILGRIGQRYGFYAGG